MEPSGRGFIQGWDKLNRPPTRNEVRLLNRVLIGGLALFVAIGVAFNFLYQDQQRRPAAKQTTEESPAMQNRPNTEEERTPKPQPPQSQSSLNNTRLVHTTLPACFVVRQSRGRDSL